MSDHNRDSDGDNPYNRHDTTNACSNLKQRCNQLGGRMFLGGIRPPLPNLWEGPTGVIEHVQAPWPMPPLVPLPPDFHLRPDVYRPGPPPVHHAWSPHPGRPPSRSVGPNSILPPAFLTEDTPPTRHNYCPPPGSPFLVTDMIPTTALFKRDSVLQPQRPGPDSGSAPTQSSPHGGVIVISDDEDLKPNFLQSQTGNCEDGDTGGAEGTSWTIDRTPGKETATSWPAPIEPPALCEPQNRGFLPPFAMFPGFPHPNTPVRRGPLPPLPIPAWRPDFQGNGPVLPNFQRNERLLLESQSPFGPSTPNKRHSGGPSPGSSASKSKTKKRKLKLRKSQPDTPSDTPHAAAPTGNEFTETPKDGGSGRTMIPKYTEPSIPLCHGLLPHMTFPTYIDGEKAPLHLTEQKLDKTSNSPEAIKSVEPKQDEMPQKTGLELTTHSNVPRDERMVVSCQDLRETPESSVSRKIDFLQNNHQIGSSNGFVALGYTEPSPVETKSCTLIESKGSENRGAHIFSVQNSVIHSKDSAVENGISIKKSEKRAPTFYTDQFENIRKRQPFAWGLSGAAVSMQPVAPQKPTPLKGSMSCVDSLEPNTLKSNESGSRSTVSNQVDVHRACIPFEEPDTIHSQPDVVLSQDKVFFPQKTANSVLNDPTNSNMPMYEPDTSTTTDSTQFIRTSSTLNENKDTDGIPKHACNDLTADTEPSSQPTSSSDSVDNREASMQRVDCAIETDISPCDCPKDLATSSSCRDLVIDLERLPDRSSEAGDSRAASSPTTGVVVGATDSLSTEARGGDGDGTAESPENQDLEEGITSTDKTAASMTNDNKSSPMELDVLPDSALHINTPETVPHVVGQPFSGETMRHKDQPSQGNDDGMTVNKTYRKDEPVDVDSVSSGDGGTSEDNPRAENNVTITVTNQNSEAEATDTSSDNHGNSTQSQGDMSRETKKASQGGQTRQFVYHLAMQDGADVASLYMTKLEEWTQSAAEVQELTTELEASLTTQSRQGDNYPEAIYDKWRKVCFLVECLHADMEVERMSLRPESANKNFNFSDELKDKIGNCIATHIASQFAEAKSTLHGILVTFQKLNHEHRKYIKDYNSEVKKEELKIKGPVILLLSQRKRFSLFKQRKPLIVPMTPGLTAGLYGKEVSLHDRLDAWLAELKQQESKDETKKEKRKTRFSEDTTTNAKAMPGDPNATKVKTSLVSKVTQGVDSDTPSDPVWPSVPINAPGEWGEEETNSPELINALCHNAQLVAHTASKSGADVATLYEAKFTEWEDRELHIGRVFRRTANDLSALMSRIHGLEKFPDRECRTLSELCFLLEQLNAQMEMERVCLRPDSEAGTWWFSGTLAARLGNKKCLAFQQRYLALHRSLKKSAKDYSRFVNDHNIFFKPYNRRPRTELKVTIPHLICLSTSGQLEKIVKAKENDDLGGVNLSLGLQAGLFGKKQRLLYVAMMPRRREVHQTRQSSEELETSDSLDMSLCTITSYGQDSLSGVDGPQLFTEFQNLFLECRAQAKEIERRLEGVSEALRSARGKLGTDANTACRGLVETCALVQALYTRFTCARLSQCPDNQTSQWRFTRAVSDIMSREDRSKCCECFDRLHSYIKRLGWTFHQVCSDHEKLIHGYNSQARRSARVQLPMSLCEVSARIEAMYNEGVLPEAHVKRRTSRADKVQAGKSSRSNQDSKEATGRASEVKGSGLKRAIVAPGGPEHVEDNAQTVSNSLPKRSSNSQPVKRGPTAKHPTKEVVRNEQNRLTSSDETGVEVGKSQGSIAEPACAQECQINCPKIGNEEHLQGAVAGQTVNESQQIESVFVAQSKCLKTHAQDVCEADNRVGVTANLDQVGCPNDSAHYTVQGESETRRDVGDMSQEGDRNKTIADASHGDGQHDTEMCVNHGVPGQAMTTLNEYTRQQVCADGTDRTLFGQNADSVCVDKCQPKIMESVAGSMDVVQGQIQNGKTRGEDATHCECGCHGKPLFDLLERPLSDFSAPESIRPWLRLYCLERDTARLHTALLEAETCLRSIQDQMRAAACRSVIDLGATLSVLWSRLRQEQVTHHLTSRQEVDKARPQEPSLGAGGDIAPKLEHTQMSLMAFSDYLNRVLTKNSCLITQAFPHALDVHNIRLFYVKPVSDSQKPVVQPPKDISVEAGTSKGPLSKKRASETKDTENVPCKLAKMDNTTSENEDPTSYVLLLLKRLKVCLAHTGHFFSCPSGVAKFEAQACSHSYVRDIFRIMQKCSRSLQRHTLWKELELSQVPANARAMLKDVGEDGGSSVYDQAKVLFQIYVQTFRGLLEQMSPGFRETLGDGCSLTELS